ncbi:MAG: hypothetical protein Q9196_007181, partial [Gyalolechia fulgens]
METGSQARLLYRPIYQGWDYASGMNDGLSANVGDDLVRIRERPFRKGLLYGSNNGGPHEFQTTHGQQRDGHVRFSNIEWGCQEAVESLPASIKSSSRPGEDMFHGDLVSGPRKATIKRNNGRGISDGGASLRHYGPYL